MTQFKKSKQQLKSIYGISAFVLGMIFLSGSFIAFLLLVLSGVLLHPKTSQKIQFNRILKRVITISFFFIGLIVGIINSSFDLTETKFDTASNKANSYQEYLEFSEKEISQLSEERKQAREKLISRIKSTNTYSKLVDSMAVSTKYLPLLTAISDGIRWAKDDKTGIDTKLINEIEKQKDDKDQLAFVNSIGFALSKYNGGFPKEIVNVFDRYKEKYGYFNNEVRILFGSDDKLHQDKKLPTFNIAPFFGLIDSENPKVLNAIYESYNGGVLTWMKDNENYNYEYLTSKSSYNQYLRKVYPNSSYVIDVDFEMSAKQLYAEYQANEVSADEKYKDKKIAITGTISDITKAFGNPIVSLHIAYLESVDFHFSSKQKQSVARLRKGQKVTLIGICEGTSVLGNGVVMKNSNVWE